MRITDPHDIAEVLVEAFEAGDCLPGASARETLIDRIAAVFERKPVLVPVGLGLQPVSTSPTPETGTGIGAPHFCLHANEVPAGRCECSPRCYCRGRTCSGGTIG